MKVSTDERRLRVRTVEEAREALAVDAPVCFLDPPARVRHWLASTWARVGFTVAVAAERGGVRRPLSEWAPGWLDELVRINLRLAARAATPPTPRLRLGEDPARPGFCSVCRRPMCEGMHARVVYAGKGENRGPVMKFECVQGQELPPELDPLPDRPERPAKLPGRYQRMLAALKPRRTTFKPTPVPFLPPPPAPLPARPCSPVLPSPSPPEEPEPEPSPQQLRRRTDRVEVAPAPRLVLPGTRLDAEAGARIYIQFTAPELDRRERERRVRLLAGLGNRGEPGDEPSDEPAVPFRLQDGGSDGGLSDWSGGDASDGLSDLSDGEVLGYEPSTEDDDEADDDPLGGSAEASEDVSHSDGWED